MTRRRKMLLSFLLLLMSFSCFVFMPPSRSQSVTRSITVSPGEQRTETFTTESFGVSRILEWIGIGALVLAAWVWRKELGVNTLGPLGSADSISQQVAGGPPRPPEESGPPPNLEWASISAEMDDAERRQRLEHIMQMFHKTHALSVPHVARQLGVPAQVAKTYLFLLTKTGQLRADGFPKNAIYTPSKSLENRILDAVRRALSEKHGILSERRYVRIKGMYEIDSLLESEEMTFMVEAKILRTKDFASRLEIWIPQLLKVAKELGKERIACVLAVACLQDSDVADVKRQVAGFTFDSGPVPVQILVFAQSELA